MNGLYLTLPIFLPLVGGLVSYLIRFPSTREAAICSMGC